MRAVAQFNMYDDIDGDTDILLWSNGNIWVGSLDTCSFLAISKHQVNYADSSSSPTSPLCKKLESSFKDARMEMLPDMLCLFYKSEKGKKGIM